MKPLRIEFAPRSLNLRQDMRRSSPLVWLALAGGLLLCLSAAYVVLDLAGQDQAGSAELQRIAAQGTQGARTNQSATPSKPRHRRASPASPSNRMPAGKPSRALPKHATAMPCSATWPP